MNQLMQGKRGIILGLANDRSIAFGIAKNLSEAGAEIALTYQSERFQSKIQNLSSQLKNSTVLGECDVSNVQHIKQTVQAIKEKFTTIDFVVHSLAFSDKNELKGRYIDTSLDNFKQTMVISCYSLVQILQEFEPLLNKQASIVTLTYYGAEKVVPNYNVMGVAKAALEASVRYLASDLGSKETGIRINSISSGPIATLAAKGIDNFSSMLKLGSKFSQLKHNVTTDEVGRVALFLLSDLSAGVTGSTIYVDSGLHNIALSSDELA